MRRHRPGGSRPSGNSQRKIAMPTSNTGQLPTNTTDTQPKGSVPEVKRHIGQAEPDRKHAERDRRDRRHPAATSRSCPPGYPSSRPAGPE